MHLVYSKDLSHLVLVFIISLLLVIVLVIATWLCMYKCWRTNLMIQFPINYISHFLYRGALETLALKILSILQTWSLSLTFQVKFSLLYWQSLLMLKWFICFTCTMIYHQWWYMKQVHGSTFVAFVWHLSWHISNNIFGSVWYKWYSF